MTNSAFAAAERNYLSDDPDWCDRLGCTNEAMPGDPLCATHGDDWADYHNQENP